MSKTGSNTGGLRIAEETVDRQTTTEPFQGKDFSLTTGRVILHALTTAESALCGRECGPDALTPIDRSWEVTYLPHLPRCDECSAGAGMPSQTTSLPAVEVDIRTAHGSDTEKAGADGLRAVLAEHDLRRWMFTDLVTVDDEMSGGVSHPLTLSPRLLTSRPAWALTTFQHEQLHWIQGPQLDAATTEAGLRWPDTPPLPAGGHDAESTWLHIVVCGLEYLSLSDVLGSEEAEDELRQHRSYSWIYEQVLADKDWLADFLERHGLRVPSQVPIPRRYFGPDWREVFASTT